MNILFDNIIVKGGWLMVPIILGSILALCITIERGIFFWRNKLNVKEFTDDIFFLVEKGEIERAIEQCKRVSHPIGAVFSTGLEQIENEITEVERAMEREGSRQVGILEKNFNYLLSIVGLEPMLGFLGTIIGLIQAFMAWEKFSTTVTVDRLAAGIYQAMITTAAGLIVAIPFYIVYNLLTHKVNLITHDLNYYGDKMISIFNKRKGHSNENQKPA
ncbi:MAG: MotA/TolQ/ExbB proton channel family protein [Spirochaetota bacterium]